MRRGICEVPQKDERKHLVQLPLAARKQGGAASKKTRSPDRAPGHTSTQQHAKACRRYTKGGQIVATGTLKFPEPTARCSTFTLLAILPLLQFKDRQKPRPSASAASALKTARRKHLPGTAPGIAKEKEGASP